MQAGFDALTAHTAVLDTQGTIVAVNTACKQFGRARGAQPAVWGVSGLNSLDVCRQAAAWTAEAQDALTILQEVLQGRQASFAMEYP